MMLMGILPAMAQAPSDAYRNSMTGSMGTARFQSLGGAMGAVGADASAAYVNPAGASLFLRNTISVGFDFGKWGTNTEGTRGMSESEKRMRNFSHLSYFFSGSVLRLDGGNYLKLNGGISYHKDFNYDRHYELLSASMPGGLTDLMTFRAINAGIAAGDYFRTKNYDPFMQNLDPLVIMGLNGEFIHPIPDSGPGAQQAKDFASNLAVWHNDGSVDYLLPTQSDLNVNERGGRKSYDVTLSGNLNDTYFFGAALRLGNSNYDRHSMYREEFSNGSSIEYGNFLKTSGSSIGLNLGAMVAIGDFARVGISYLTPQFAQYEELYRSTTRMINMDFTPANRQIDFDSGEYRSSYSMFLPGQFTGSVMAFLGRYGFVSYDYQYRNLGSAKLLINNTLEEMGQSKYIREDYAGEHTHRIGIELRPISWLSLRGGYSYTGNPMKVAALRQDAMEELLYEVPTSGTITDFTLPRSLKTLSGGVGVNLGGGFTVDMAYVRSKRSEAVYPFSGYVFQPEPNVEAKLSARGGKLIDVKSSFVTTLVFRF